MKKKTWLPLLLVVVLMCSVIPSVAAFSDVRSHPLSDRITALQQNGVLIGELNGEFNPDGQLTYAAGLTMIVKGLDISLAKFKFIQAPKASDYYTYVEDEQWYSDTFVIAHVNGLDIPKDVKPDQLMTREQFAHHLMRAIETHGDYAYPMIFIVISDETDISPEFSNSVQKVLIAKFASLDQEGRFHPKSVLTRGDAASWLFDAIKFKDEAVIHVEDHDPLFDMELVSEVVNSDINKITVSAQAPHPGYGIRIASILFEGDQAVIFTETSLPDPDFMYPQVITEVTATVYVGSEYKPVLAKQWMEQPVQSEQISKLE